MFEIENPADRDAQEIADAIRKDSREAYVTHIQKMKARHLKYDMIKKYHLGDLVSVVVPKNIAKPEAKHLPAVVSRITNKDGMYCYRVCVGYYQLEHTYYNHELTALVGMSLYYGHVVHQKPYEYIAEILERSQEKTLVTVSFTKAYNEYRKMLNPDASDVEEDASKHHHQLRRVIQKTHRKQRRTYKYQMEMTIMIFRRCSN
jgi:hypothetical protein